MTRRAALSTAGRPGRARGFALLLVLWTLVLIGFVTARLAAGGRVEARIAGNLSANAAAEAAIEGAVDAAVFNLGNADPSRRWALDGSTHQLVVGGSRVTLQLDDEAARINPNLAPPGLMEGLLRAAGSKPDDAQTLAANIADWVGSGLIKRQPGEMLGQYQAAGLDYGPPGAPLESIDELGNVLGMTPALLDAIRPHLTLYGPATPHPRVDPVVDEAAKFSGAASTGGAGGLLGVAPGQQDDTQLARIVARAQGPSGAQLSRTAIVQLGRGTYQGYVMLAWGADAD